jgi:hypothetical protein
VDGNGIAGVEKYFDERLRGLRTSPLRLSIDVRVQLALRDAVQTAVDALFLGGPGMQPFAAKIFNLMEYDFDPSLLAISTYIIFGSFAAIYFLQRAIGLDQLTRTGGG